MRRLPALVVAGLVLSGCGSSGAPSLSDQPTSAQPVSCDPAAATPSPTGPVDLAVKPVVEIPDAAPPCSLVTADLAVGTGAVAEAGRTLTVKYVGVTYLDGQEFDTSWGKPDFTFLLGGGEVIAGWDQGFVGMRAGGRRQLIIPPELGYGARGSDPIPPNAPLVFIVDLVAVS